jgi:hypothetical protein
VLSKTNLFVFCFLFLFWFVFGIVFGSGLAHFQCCQKALSMLPKETFTAKNNFKEEGVIAFMPSSSM